MKTFTRFGTEKSDSGIALRCYEGFENRRAWEAIIFCVHPKHCCTRDDMGVETGFTVFLPAAGPT